MMITWNYNTQPSTRTQTHTGIHTLKTSAFPVSPNNARTSSSASRFSGWRGRNHSLVTRCSPLPPYLHPTHPLSILHTSPLSLVQCFSLILQLSYVIDFFLTALTFVSLPLPHRPTQIHTVEVKDDYLLQEKACTHTQTNTLQFLTGGRMFPRSKVIFTCHWQGLTAKNTASIFTGCVYLLVWKRDVEVVFKKTAMENLE